MGAAAQLERGMIVNRMQRGRLRRGKRTGYIGGPTVPFGQRVEGEGRDARVVADPEAASTVAVIVQLRRSGLTLAGIAERLNAEGVATPRVGRWHIGSVRRVLLREGSGGA